ncbi:hypothetical protein OIU79_020963 [Salix purpurea]|uniref:Uncharacterized protein n=1 Tax=Salix purpurea TaxID=77065 RepID=A0A9Q0WN96_SALPP|nr:hypothetical protein OIU79_020963 [Salix purpurea]
MEVLQRNRVCIACSGFSFSGGYYPYYPFSWCIVQQLSKAIQVQIERRGERWVGAHMAGVGFQAWFSVLGINVCVCGVGFDGSGNIEWQSLLGEAAEAAISGIRVVAAVAQPPRRG